MLWAHAGSCAVPRATAQGFLLYFPMYGQQGTTCTSLPYIVFPVLIAPVVPDIRIYTVRTILVTSVVCPLCDAEVSLSSVYYVPTYAYYMLPRRVSV